MSAMEWVLAARDMYDDPARGYHNWEHVQYCLDRLVRYRYLAHDMQALRTAIVFHDVVYDFQPPANAQTNEYLSAVYAMEYLDRVGSSATFAAKVYGLILATEHKTPGRTPDERLIQDIDLMGFTASNFLQNGAGIRKEYEHVADEIFYPERIKVLNYFLGKSPFFNTPEIEHELGDRARENIKEEIKQIEAT